MDYDNMTEIEAGFFELGQKIEGELKRFVAANPGVAFRTKGAALVGFCELGALKVDIQVQYVDGAMAKAINARTPANDYIY